MNIKISPLLIAISFLAFKFIVLIENFSKIDFFGWTFIGLIWLWITWNFWKDKSMPAVYGSMHYKNGENNPLRIIYVIMITILFSGMLINDIILLIK